MRETTSSWEHSCSHIWPRPPERSADWMTSVLGMGSQYYDFEIIWQSNLICFSMRQIFWCLGWYMIVWCVTVCVCVCYIMLPLICLSLKDVLLFHTLQHIPHCFAVVYIKGWVCSLWALFYRPTLCSLPYFPSQTLIFHPRYLNWDELSHWKWQSLKKNKIKQKIWQTGMHIQGKPLERSRLPFSPCVLGWDNWHCPSWLLA